MRKLIYLFAFFIGSMCYSNITAQTTTNLNAINAPTDVPHGYVYNFELAQDLIINRQIQPDAANIEADAIISAANFPKLKNANALNTSYKEKLKVWMEKNHEIIINALKSRKDIVYPY